MLTSKQKEQHALVIQSTVKQDIVNHLKAYIMNIFSALDWEFGNAYVFDPSNPMPHATVNVSADGQVTIPDGIVRRRGKVSCQDKDEKLILVISLAFQAVLHNMEKVLQKDLKNAKHHLKFDIVLNMVDGLFTDKSRKLSWHTDGTSYRPFPVCSLIYFLHDACEGLLSFMQADDELVNYKEEKDFASIKTQEGMSVTFADQILFHEVTYKKKQEVTQVGLPAFRGFLLMQYLGPYELPKNMLNVSHLGADAIEKQEEAGDTIYFKTLLHSKL